MIQNNLQTLIDYVKDLSGQTNVSDAQIIRALNFGTDHLFYIKQMAGSKVNPDSSNQENLSRVTVTTSDTILSIDGGQLEKGEALTFRHLEIGDGSYFERLISIDSRDAMYEYLQNQTGVPQYFDIEGNVIRLLPKPNASYTYRLSYGRVHPRFSADNLTQSTGLLPNEEEYVALYATDRIMIGMSDSARSAVRNELKIKEDEIKKMTALRDQSTSKRVKPKASTLTSNAFNRGYFGGSSQVIR